MGHLLGGRDTARHPLLVAHYFLFLHKKQYLLGRKGETKDFFFFKGGCNEIKKTDSYWTPEKHVFTHMKQYSHRGLQTLPSIWHLQPQQWTVNLPVALYGGDGPALLLRANAELPLILSPTLCDFLPSTQSPESAANTLRMTQVFGSPTLVRWPLAQLSLTENELRKKKHKLDLVLTEGILQIFHVESS